MQMPIQLKRMSQFFCYSLVVSVDMSCGGVIECIYAMAHIRPSDFEYPAWLRTFRLGSCGTGIQRFAGNCSPSPSTDSTESLETQVGLPNYTGPTAVFWLFQRGLKVLLNAIEAVMVLSSIVLK